MATPKTIETRCTYGSMQARQGHAVNPGGEKTVLIKTPGNDNNNTEEATIAGNEKNHFTGLGPSC